MKLNVLFILSFLFCLTSCGDESCTQADWIGTYTLDSSECSEEGISMSNTISIAAGDTDETIIVGTESMTFDKCSASNAFISVDLDGEVLNAAAFGCTGVYMKN